MACKIREKAFRDLTPDALANDRTEGHPPANLYIEYKNAATAKLQLPHFNPSRVVSRVLSFNTVIYLGPSLPTDSSDVSQATFTRRLLRSPLSCSGWGLHGATRLRVAGELLPRLFILTANAAVIFCCTFLEVAFTVR